MGEKNLLDHREGMGKVFLHIQLMPVRRFLSSDWEGTPLMR